MSPTLPKQPMKRIVLLLTALACTARADVKLPALFGDHLVLQRDKPVAIWGTADAGEDVTVKFADQSKKATASKDGSWKVTLEPLKTSSTPAELTVKGKNEIKLTDILVGEVWICSGQSNMELPVSRVNNAQAEADAAKFPKIRHIAVKKAASEEPLKDIQTDGWKIADNATDVMNFTAAGYFFARELNKELNIPIGLIHTSWGGTRAEAWTSKPALAAGPSGKAIIASWEENLKAYDPAKEKEKYDASVAKIKAANEKINTENALPGAQAKPLLKIPAFDDHTKSQHRPAVLFNAMIAPLVPYSVRGAIWYQGESNRLRAVQYQTLLPNMIKDWRKQWGDQFSFYIVQLAGFDAGRPHPAPTGADDDWAEVQWAQLQTAIKTPKSGLAVTNDIGDAKDIHPKNKQEVGRRLALQALVKDYGKKDLVSGGPIYGGGETMANKYVISFSNIGGGLRVRDGGDLKGFIIAGEDKVWKPAKAKIMGGKQVHVWSDEVAKPVACRYAWESWTDANLINKEGLPASLFRTDKWDLSTKGVEDPFALPVKVAPKPAVKEEIKPAVKVEEAPKKKAA